MAILSKIFSSIKWLLLGLVTWIIIVLVVVRVVRRFYQLPIPAFMVRLIDNPFRRRIQPPKKIVEWMGVRPGMILLEIGPGPGTFTFEAARETGAEGCVHAVDIQEAVITLLKKKIGERGVDNVIPEQASAYDLPYPAGYFDRVYMVTVLGEIPDKQRALAEIRRVLKADSCLAIGEFLIDPDYPRRSTTKSWCRESGFVLFDEHGNWMHYLLIFSKTK